jgi:hypothetical protein
MVWCLCQEASCTRHWLLVVRDSGHGSKALKHGTGWQFSVALVEQQQTSSRPPIQDELLFIVFMSWFYTVNATVWNPVDAGLFVWGWTAYDRVNTASIDACCSSSLEGNPCWECALASAAAACRFKRGVNGSTARPACGSSCWWRKLRRILRSRLDYSTAPYCCMRMHFRLPTSAIWTCCAQDLACMRSLACVSSLACRGRVSLSGTACLFCWSATNFSQGLAVRRTAE